MITTIRKGPYKLIETRGQTKVLHLGDKDFAWISVKSIGELLVSTHTGHKTDHVLAQGEYRLYNVKKEPTFTDLQHLELSTGENSWQGYLLLTGLPNETKKRSRIIPTTEVISGL